MVSFAVQYLWFVPWMWFAQQTFDAATGTGQGLVVEFLAGSIVTTVVLLGPLLVVAGRWPLPCGAATLCFTATQMLESLALSHQGHAVILALLGGLAFDLAYLSLGGGRAGLLLGSNLKNELQPPTLDRPWTKWRHPDPR